MNPSIPEEIVIQIFTWLPVKSLVRFKCVTKLFNSLVSESYFMDIHTSHSMIRQGGTKYFLNRRKFYKGKIEKSLLPAFGVLMNSPSISLFVPEENKYKVLLTQDASGLYIKQCVFTLGIDKSWRKTQRIPRSILYMPGVCINGAIYRLVFHGERLSIDAFDLKTESFKLIILKSSSKWWYYELIEVRVFPLAGFRVLGQNQKGEEWKSHIIHYPSMWKHIQPKIIPHVILSCTFCDGQILFILNLESCALCSSYDITRQSWRKLEIKGLPTNHCIRGIYSYIERLVM
ncbi:hypothetical protein R3W88_001165 [Solanum pinnatisectum]|uniref:F-box domain-containing protein n=1 Tax=Solanum pinnatisectum TaxID=50273 RepID=A0AAV9MHN0_9SOLN|nr:hypothetical protein R3W88_001165 [Solanum pinnatisectum]